MFLPKKPYIYIADKNFQKKFFKMKQKSIPQCAKHQRQWFETTFQSTKIIRGPSKGVWVKNQKKPRFGRFSMSKSTLQTCGKNPKIYLSFRNRMKVLTHIDWPNVFWEHNYCIHAAPDLIRPPGKIHLSVSSQIPIYIHSK